MVPSTSTSTRILIHAGAVHSGDNVAGLAPGYAVPVPSAAIQ
jgi:hypothetical protein